MGGEYSKPPVIKTCYNTKEWRAANLASQKGRTVAITGTTSGTGFEAARIMGELGADVLLLNRPSERSKSSLEALQSQVPDANFVQIDCDLQDLASVQRAAEDIKSRYGNGKLNCLCLNAGVMAIPDEPSGDGYNKEIQTNVISQFVLCKELYPEVSKAEDPRIVWHSSIARVTVNKFTPEYFEKKGGQLGGNGNSFQNAFMAGPRWKRYGNTKLANIVLAQALTQKQDKVKVLCAHPGLSATSLQVKSADTGGMGPIVTNLMMKNLAQNPEDGAMGIVRCMADPNVKSGEFYGPKGGMSAFYGPAQSLPLLSQETSKENVDVLWSKLEQATGEWAF